MNYYRRGGGFFDSLPRVTKILLIINLAAFILTFLMSGMGYDLNYMLGLHDIVPTNYSHPASGLVKPYSFAPLQIVTHMFLHGGLGHIFFNMFGLFMFGKVLETYLGEKRFFILYFVSGLGAALLQLGVNYYFNAELASQIMQFYSDPDLSKYETLVHKIPIYSAPINKSPLEIVHNAFAERLSIPMIGASGALMGILAAFALFFPNVELMLIFIPIPIKAKYFIPIFALLSLVLGVTGSMGGVAHFAHLGGAIFGFILAYIWKRNRFKIL